MEIVYIVRVKSLWVICYSFPSKLLIEKTPFPEFSSCEKLKILDNLPLFDEQ